MVAFDVEGVVLPTQRYLLEEITLLNNLGRLEVLFNGFLYQVGISHLKQSLERIYSNFKGISFEEFGKIFDRIQLIPETQEVFNELKKRGLSIALISSGIPEQFVQKLAQKLGADYAVGPIIEIEDGKLTGKIFGEIIDAYGKRQALTNILEEASIPSSACAVVADDRNNILMFEAGALKIGFNPDFALTTKSDYVIRSSLKEILPLIFDEPETNISNPRKGTDYLRETIHIGSFLIPILCQFFGVNRFILSIIIIFTATGYVLGEVARFQGHNLPPFTNLTKLAVTGSEQWDLALAPLYLAVGVTLCLIIFPQPPGYVGITVVTLGDGVAKIFGRRWGRIVIPFNKPKTVEGTLAGVVASALITSLYISPLKALVVTSIGMLTELIPTPINDNLLIPFVASASGLALV